MKSIVFILFLCFLFSLLIRIFPDSKREPIIHEFDPQFNFRITKFIEEKSLKEFFLWFDNNSWHQQGRFIGETSYPGLMITTIFIKKIVEISSYFHFNQYLDTVHRYNLVYYSNICRFSFRQIS